MVEHCLRCLYFPLRCLGLGGNRIRFRLGGGIMRVGIMIIVLLRSRWVGTEGRVIMTAFGGAEANQYLGLKAVYCIT